MGTKNVLSAVVQSFKHYATKRSRVRFPMVSLEFFIAIIYGPEVYSASDGNDDHQYFLAGT
jgi:hypothetical protein